MPNHEFNLVVNVLPLERGSLQSMLEESDGDKGEFDHPVVAVGASAGGVEALKSFVSEIPTDTPASFIILQHLAPDHDSQLGDILSRSSDLPVLEADENMPVSSGHIYVIQPDKYLTIVDHGLFLEPPTQRRGLRMPIDHFMRSLAETAGNLAVGVVLSGTGNDGTAGLKAIKGAGGVTLAQDPETALYDGMPRAAIEAGVVDKVGGLPALAANIVEIANRLRDVPAEGAFARKDMQSVLALLKTRMGHDFAPYKGGTITRRVQRRMNLLRFETLPDYVSHLRENSDEMRQLFDDLLINVTCFFRDDDVWEAITKEAIVPLIERQSKSKEPVRIWVPACSSGEEAFTLAMLMDEHCAQANPQCDWQIFATDLDSDAIAQGREGYYRSSIADDISAERLQQYFQREAEGFRIRKHLREKVVFAQQNLLTDPPFSRLDLISCRNLLIYLDNKVQGQVLETFHFALKEGGFLVLGTSETSGTRQNEFKTVNSRAHIYGRKPGRSIPRVGPRSSSYQNEPTTEFQRPTRRDRERDLSVQVRRSLIDRYAPASVAVKADGEISYFHGPVRRFIDQPEGAPTHSIFEILPPPLRSRAREAIKAVAEGENPSHRSARIRYPDRDTSVCLECVKIEADEGELFLLSFIEEEHPETAQGPAEDDDSKYVRQLENELAILQEELQTTVEELETSNEELKASHEEAVAANEELQSANEELETSREELQSLNEELVTVNNQLEEKINEVEKTSDDLRNLLTSTKLPVLFLGPKLTISGFTPSVSELVELRDSDIGRPVTELAFKADDPTLLDDIDLTLDNLGVSEKQIVSEADCTYLRRVQPYRTSDERIHGVVVTYADITEQARIAARLSERERQQSIIAELGQKGLAARDTHAFLNELCAILRVAYDCDYSKVLVYEEACSELLVMGGAGWSDGIVGKARVPDSVKSQAGYTLKEKVVLVTDFATERRFEAPQLLKSHDVSSGISCVIEIGGKPWGVLGLHDRDPDHFREEDLLIVQAAANVAAATIKQVQREHQTARESLILSLAIKTAEMGVWQYDAVTQDVVWDERLREMIGRTGSREKPSAADFFAMIHPGDLERVRSALAHTIATGAPFAEEFRLTRADGKLAWLNGRGERIIEGDHTRVIGINSDITERKLAEEQNNFIMRELDHRVKNILAIILSIAKITGANAPDFETFSGAFEKRLYAMARTHSLLAESRWQGADMRSLVEDELSQSSELDNLEIEGPAVSLTASAAQSISMALHELATNAMKYGSLSVPDGALRVAWQWHRQEGSPDDVLDFVWEESGGPPVEKPERKGFGSTVIERILRAQLSAETEIDFAPEGLRVTCAIPSSRILPGSVADRQATASPGSPLPPVDLSPLDGARILVLDDEWLLAEQYTNSLVGAGCSVVGPFNDLEGAIGAVNSEQLDFAVVDFNIDGTESTPLLELLEKRKVPFLVVSGYGSELNLTRKLEEGAFLAKPTSPAAMLSRIAQSISRRHG
jgi:two-component system CheB/CheR fusion protein|tara:strand:- start:12537 stop:17015 length:4479 start_codon:yes stop_codon:yes gene_type:complete